MKLKYTILYVADVAATLAFYQSAFGVESKMVHESGLYAELDTGVTTLAFAAAAMIRSQGRHPGIPDPNHPVFEIAFETDDVPAGLAGGATPVEEPRRMPWGQTVSYVTDLNGYLVEICSPVVHGT
jgi:lactoylglutathione lyase